MKQDEDATPSTCKQKQDDLDDILDVIPNEVKKNVKARKHLVVGGSSSGSNQQERKMNKALEKEAKKRKLQEDKKDREARIQMNKVYKPGECMQYINVVVNENLLRKWYMASVQQEVAAAGANIELQQSSNDQGIITWTRKLPQTLDKYFAKLKKPNEEKCDHALCVMEVECVTRLVQSNCLARTMIEFKEQLECKMTLVVVQVEAYFKSKPGRKEMSNIDFELALTGAGVSQLWQQMLAMLPQSSLDIARALCAQYKSPLAIYESLQEPDALEQLSSVGVSRSGVAGAKQRRLGREFALKLYTLFTARSGDVIVGDQADD
ncbi:hypothetical protein HW555_000702 [Spodoptera exigua]|uniref:ERCC4 domain-containing protein n=1 Tax=Spodoptera exigua TaxID=7107 RepID=A0A835L9E5_SPOEX|nr:hypothetical protein HW555_000702 [Spodoptera exigua]